MKKIIVLCLCVCFALSLCACTGSSDDDMPVGAEGAISEADADSVKLSAVLSAGSETLAYYCDICQGDCTFYTGRFSYPALRFDTEDAKMINDKIFDSFSDTYETARKTVQENSGIASGFTYSVFDDGEFAAIRTAVATVMLHSGGLYSYDVYYYDITNQCVASSVDFAEHLGLDSEVLASYARLKMQESGKYSSNQIAAVTADGLDVFPVEDGYYLKYKGEYVKYEDTVTGLQLNELAEEIASDRAPEETVESIG